MFRSIAEDVQRAFQTGNMVIRILILNIAVYMVTALFEAFFPSWSQTVMSWIALPGSPATLLTRPWTLITHMFIHAGFWHMAWNMLMFYWFGTIVGDLLGDRRILPVYILGGLTGALAYILSYQLLPSVGSMALGASAAVLALVFTAVATAPDYNMRLILLGDVKIKYIGLFILFFDLIGVRGNINSGGHIAHLGGAMFGFLFVYFLRNGTDITDFVYRIQQFFKRERKPSRQRKSSPLRVEYKAGPKYRGADIRPNAATQMQHEVDRILDKIKVSGYESLTDEEKETLYKASKES